MHYDGENDTEAFSYFRENHSLHLPGEAHESVLAIISPEEIGAITRGVSGILQSVSDGRGRRGWKTGRGIQGW